MLGGFVGEFVYRCISYCDFFSRNDNLNLKYPFITEILLLIIIHVQKLFLHFKLRLLMLKINM